MEQEKNTWIWVFLAIVLLLLFGSFGMEGYGMMGFGIGFGLMFMILFWGVIAWLVFMLVNAAQTSKKDEDPVVILKKRYASGEISKKQYEEMRKELMR